MRYELILSVLIDESEEDPARAASDAFGFVWRHMVNQEKRLQAGFGAKLTGGQARKIDRGCCFGCPAGVEINAPAEDDEVQAA